MKIFYVHVGKAGGTSFNRVLQRHFRGEVHCERYIELQGEVPRQRVLGNLDGLRALDFISGHIPYPVLKRSDLDLDDYEVVTILRHPPTQTLSHLNWVIKISEDTGGHLFRGVAPPVQEMSLKLRSVPEWDPTSVAHWLRVYADWFQNHQSRYFSEHSSVDAALEALGCFGLVGVTERLDAFVSRFYEIAGLKAPRKSQGAPHDNRNRSYRVPGSLLSSPVLAAFLADYNQLDDALYDHVARHLAP